MNQEDALASLVVEQSCGCCVECPTWSVGRFLWSPLGIVLSQPVLPIWFGYPHRYYKGIGDHL